MRKLLSVFVLIALAPLTASAQETPRAELFIGYSYLHLDDGMSKKLGFFFKKLTPFAQILFGGAHDEDPNNSVTAFAWTTGGGVDVSVSKHFSVRLMQIEYARATSRGLTENNVRISAGLVLRFGKR